MTNSRTRTCVVAVALAAALTVTAFSEGRSLAGGRPRISHVNEVPAVEQVAIGNDPRVDLRGVVDGARDDEPRVVQVVIRRVYDGQLSVTPPARLEQSERRGPASWTWFLASVALPTPHFGRGYEITAVLLPPDRWLHDVTDGDTLNRLVLARSEPVRLTLTPRVDERPPDGACHFELMSIRDVYGQDVPAASPDIEIGLVSEVRARIDKPRGAFEYVLVRPLGSPHVWVMPEATTFAGREWRGAAYFGRPGLDFGETFILQGVVLRHAIAADRLYTAQDWQRIRGDACAASADVRVRRRVGPGDLKITKVGDTFVSSSRAPIETDTEATVSGGIENMHPEFALKPAEPVWILTRMRGTEGWLVSALAIVQPDRLSWRAPAVRFTSPGDHQMIAIASRIKLPLGRHLSADDWYRLSSIQLVRRLSPSVVVRPGHDLPAGAQLR